jgi:hypothetical protein
MGQPAINLERKRLPYEVDPFVEPNPWSADQTQQQMGTPLETIQAQIARAGEVAPPRAPRFRPIW